MVKKRKNREDKIKADTRHFSYHFEPSLSAKPQNKIEVSETNPAPVKPQSSYVVSYPYLKHDLRKTLLVTATILVFQVLIFLILRSHTFPFVGINY